MHVDLPKKLYYSIGEVAKAFKVKNSLIRFWDGEFDILKPKKNAKGNRRFTPEDIKNLKIIPINGVYADQELINYVKNNRSIIGTMDKDLKNKIKKLDSSILSIHNDKIVLES